MGGESNGEIRRLRSQGQRLGIAIRMQRSSPASQSRAYSLIDRDTGKVIYADVALDDVQTRLWWIMRDRRRVTIAPVQAAQTPPERCSSCGTLRIAAFRWCTSCGFDYEASIKPSPYPSTWATGPAAADVLLPTEARRKPVDLPRGRAPLRTRLVEFGYWAWRDLRSAPLREIGIGAVLALLVGVIVSIVASAR